MTETNVTGQAVQAAPDDETKFKTWLKEKYQIEDDPDTFSKKRANWQKSEEELPQYQSTLTALIQHIKDQEEAAVRAPVKGAVEDEEERLRTIAKLDPYEGAKRYFAKKEQELEEKFKSVTVQAAQESERAVMRREGLRRAHDIVKQQWPEAFDPNSELHKMGKQIYQQEMSQAEQMHPMAFLIATERAAGRTGVAPKGKRGNSNRRDVAAQSVTRDRVKADSPDVDDKPLTARQKQVAQGLGVDEKVYKAAMKNRREQGKKKEEDE